MKLVLQAQSNDYMLHDLIMLDNTSVYVLPIFYLFPLKSVKGVIKAQIIFLIKERL